MARPNVNFLQLKENYLFSDISKKVEVYRAAHPERSIIRLGIGDVTLPLPHAAIKAIHAATEEMAHADTFHGYGPEQGYAFLREAVAQYYEKLGVQLDVDEIFISDGAKSDIANITDLFDADNTAFIPDPVYPVYVDTNIMNHRRIRYMDANCGNDFLPLPSEGMTADLIYICSPNNPTGAAYNRDQLKAWVDFANAQGAVILFDAAYEAFIAEDLPRSIFEIPGARTCAVEFCSLSKTAGFTGTRCGYTVIPHELTLLSDGKRVSLNKLWLRRQTTKFNGVPYIIQRGAAAVFSSEGLQQVRDNISYYMANAKKIADTLTELHIPFFGGINSPYIWMQCPDHMTSWDFFDYLLDNAALVGTPGCGFGKNGEGYFRLTSFNTHENTHEAMERLRTLLR